MTTRGAEESCRCLCVNLSNTLCYALYFVQLRIAKVNTKTLTTFSAPRVVTSSGSDTYSVMAAALCSLKGPKHGGANIKVQQMMERSLKSM